MEELWPDLLDTYRALGDFGAKHGVRVCIETMWPPTVEQFVRLVHEIGHPFVGACVDVGHVAWTVPQKLRGTAEGVALYNDNLAALVEGLGPKLMHFHVHDVRPSDWRDHRACGTGCIDWSRLFGLLKGLGYAGSLALELEEYDLVGALVASKRILEGLTGA
ncbi:MAG: sugar phosphate isomerase/epimerase [Planctomycetes bacterium]|nr:sugar phosphate isomerase/epimerase [Planctomycetota bacterium]